MYEKTEGSAQSHGHNFEYKSFALLYLRLKKKGCKFNLACNVKGHGNFDDVVVEYLDDNSRKSHIFLQLKSKLTKPVTMKELLDVEGKFGLRSYYESYIKIENKFNCSSGAKLGGSIDDSLFILYTNAGLEKNIKSNKVTDIGEADFIMTGGSVLQFNENDHKDIYKHLENLPEHRNFFRRFRIFYSQANERDMETHIKTELQHSKKLSGSELDIYCTCFISRMKDWLEREKFFLTDTISRENDPLENISEKVKHTFLTKLLDERKTEVENLGFKYKDSPITKMKQLTENHKAVLIFTPGRSTTLTAAKIHQMLGGTKHIILNLKQLNQYKTEVMLGWRSEFDVLVLERKKSPELSQDLFQEFSWFLNDSVAEKKFIFISNNVGNTKHIRELWNIFHANFTKNESFKFTDIVTEPEKLFLDKYVSFQGREVKLGTLVKNDDYHLLNEFDYDLISLLLENENPSIGKRTEHRVNYYIDRTLQCRKQANTPFPGQGEMQPASSGDILQDVPDNISHLEENLRKSTTKDWKPNTLLEGDGQIILLTDEPGMGKSTLLTHLAQQTRDSNPEMWIVRVNIKKCTTILNELKDNGCDEEGVIKLLMEAAQIKKSDSIVLEERLFNYTYKSTGNMAVLIDGVDEVSPHYTKEVIQILKNLTKTNIKRIWVTSQSSVRDWLETEFQCQSYSLVPFSEADQETFLTKFWKKKCPEIEDNYLENFAKQVVNLSTEQLNVQDKKFLGIPLQIWLLAEKFERNLMEYITSKKLESLEHINIVMLYDLYVKKKWDIHISKKKDFDRTKVEVLYKNFINGLMSAALEEILTSQQLTDKRIAKDARLFLKEFKEKEEELGTKGEVFEHRTLAEYLAARWLCDNLQDGQKSLTDHLFESGFHVFRSMVDKILAVKYPLHEAVLNSSLIQVEKSLRRKESITEKDRGGRTALHVAVSCRNPKLINLLLEHGADVHSVDTLLGLSPVQYAIRMVDWEMLSLLMEKRPEIREQVLKGSNRDCTENIACALRAATKYGHNELLKYLISKGSSENAVLSGDNSTLRLAAARSQQTETEKKLLLLEASIDCQYESGRAPLHVSVETGKCKVTISLDVHQKTVHSETELQHVVNPERTVRKRNTEGNTIDKCDVQNENDDIPNFQSQQNVSLDVWNSHEHIPSLKAVCAGRNQMEQDLVERNSDINTQGTDEMLPLDAGIQNGNMKMTLVQDGIALDRGDAFGFTAIRGAAMSSHKSLNKCLLQNGSCVNVLDCEGVTTADMAVREANFCADNEFLDHDPKIRPEDTQIQKNQLYEASGSGDLEDVLVRLKCGISVNTNNKEGNTPLHDSAKSGHKEVNRFLVNCGDEVSRTNSQGNTTLILAAEKGYVENDRKLLCARELHDPSTPLHSGATDGHIELVRELPKHGANVNFANKSGDTSLYIAVREGHVEKLRDLLEHGANVNTANKDGDTPLNIAVRKGHVEVVRELLKYGANVNTAGKDGDIPLYIAVPKGHVEVLRELLKNGAISNTADKEGDTPLHIAVWNGHGDVLRELLEYGANVNTANKKGDTPLQVAVRNGHVDVLRELLKYGANVNTANKSGDTPLHVAVRNGHVEVFRELLKSGANVNTADKDGDSPLHIAVRKGHKEVVRELVVHGVNVNTENKEGDTPLNIADRKGHEELLRELR